MSATEYLVESIVRPDAFHAPGTGRMPNVAGTLSNENLRHLVAYLAALGGQPDYEAIARTDIDTLRPKESTEARSYDVEQAERGKRVFLGEGKCSQCHTLKRTVESGLIAPPVRYMAMHDPRYLRESMEDPNKVIADTYKQYTVVTSDGVVHTGRIMRREKDRILILTVDSAGKMQPLSIPLAEVAQGDNGEPQIVASDVSVMPKPELTPSQIDDLVTFLNSATDTAQPN
jgi:putative heme-binding domain-containing protein